MAGGGPAMGVPIRNPEPMTAQEFFAFTATRPDEEKWELIDGEPVMNASASFLHQIIVKNLLIQLAPFEIRSNGQWVSIPGISVRVSDTNVPVPDVLIRPNTPVLGSECDDMIVAFEVLSPSTADRDLRWKRRAYSTLPSLRQYVIIAQDTVEVVSYERSTGFAERRFERLTLDVDLPALGVNLPVADLYRGTNISDA
jgi:Uma2 family endonuclease